jgi:hypothetical protein
MTRAVPLSTIAHQQNNSIMSLLIDIVRNTERTNTRVWSFLQNLECLRLPQRPSGQELCVKVNRETIDARLYQPSILTIFIRPANRVYGLLFRCTF